MSSRPAISIIIPTYNSDRYLSQAIESVLAQTTEDYELIIVDDGSTDDTAQIITHYLQTRRANKQRANTANTPNPHRPSPFIRYIHQSHQGAAVARNHGIQLARGTYIMFLAPEDWVTPTTLVQQQAVLDANPAIGMVHSGWQRVDSHGKRLANVTPWHYCPYFDLVQVLEWMPVLTSAMMFRKKWLIKADGFAPRFPLAEEVDLVLRLAAMDCPTAWLKEITVYERQHDDRTRQSALRRARSLSAVINQFFLRSDLSPAIRRNERKMRFSTWSWIAWYLQYTGHPQEMVKFLKQSWPYSHQPPVDTVIFWVERFAQLSKNWGSVLDTEALCQSSAWTELTQWCIAQANLG